MKKTLLMLALLCLAGWGTAGDLITKSGKTYKNYALMGAAPNGIRVFHEEGVVILPVSEFPDDMAEIVKKIAKDIPAAKKAAQEKIKERMARKNAQVKKNKAEKARQKKSEALLKKEAEEEKKRQEKLRKLTPVNKNAILKK